MKSDSQFVHILIYTKQTTIEDKNNHKNYRMSLLKRNPTQHSLTNSKKKNP
jgi:hypothetical protein